MAQAVLNSCYTSEEDLSLRRRLAASLETLKAMEEESTAKFERLIWKANAERARMVALAKEVANLTGIKEKLEAPDQTGSEIRANLRTKLNSRAEAFRAVKRAMELISSEHSNDEDLSGNNCDHDISVKEDETETTGADVDKNSTKPSSKSRNIGNGREDSDGDSEKLKIGKEKVIGKVVEAAGTSVGASGIGLVNHIRNVFLGKPSFYQYRYSPSPDSVAEIPEYSRDDFLSPLKKRMKP